MQGGRPPNCEPSEEARCDGVSGGDRDEPPSLHQLLAIPDVWAPGSELALEEPPRGETADEWGVRGTRSKDTESLGRSEMGGL